MHSPTSSWEKHLVSLAQEALHSSRDGLTQDARKGHDQNLHQAMAACETITARHSRSFFLATRLLPGEKRLAMRALYAFCRTADNLADEAVKHPEAKLQDLRRMMSGERNIEGDLVLKAWASVRARFHIPLRYAEQLLDGVECDLEHRRYRTFKELAVYCYGVASTVGLMSMHITGYSDQRAIPYAIKLGVALQLTNILRDVREDWEAGRVYLPAEELEIFGLDESDIAAARVDDRWRNFMRFQIARARRLYSEAIPGIALLHQDGHLAVSAAAFLYKGILDDIESHDFDVFNRRAYIGRVQKLAALWRAFLFTVRFPSHAVSAKSLDGIG